MKSRCLLCGKAAQFAEKHDDTKTFCSRDCQRQRRKGGGVGVDKITSNLAQMQLARAPIGEGILTRMLRKPYQPSDKHLEELSDEWERETNQERRYALFLEIRKMVEERTPPLNRDVFFSLIAKLDKWPVQRILADLMDDSGVDDYGSYMDAVKQIIRWLMMPPKEDEEDPFQKYFQRSQDVFLATLFRDALREKAWRIVEIMLTLRQEMSPDMFPIYDSPELVQFIKNAVLSGDTKTVHLLTDNGFDLLSIRHGYFTMAIERRDRNMVEAIVEGADKLYMLIDNEYVIAAAHARDFEIFKLLIINSEQAYIDDFETFVRETIKYGELETLKHVLEFFKSPIVLEKRKTIRNIFGGGTFAALYDYAIGSSIKFNRVRILQYLIQDNVPELPIMRQYILFAIARQSNDCFDFLLTQEYFVEVLGPWDELKHSIEYNNMHAFNVLAKRPDADLSRAFAEALRKQKLDMLRIIVSQPHFHPEVELPKNYEIYSITNGRRLLFLDGGPDFWNILFARPDFRQYLSEHLHEVIVPILNFPRELPYFLRVQEIFATVKISPKILTRTFGVLVNGDRNLPVVQWIIENFYNQLNKRYFGFIAEYSARDSWTETFRYLMGIQDFRDRISLAFILKEIQMLENIFKKFHPGDKEKKNHLFVLKAVKKDKEERMQVMEPTQKRRKEEGEEDLYFDPNRRPWQSL